MIEEFDTFPSEKALVDVMAKELLACSSPWEDLHLVREFYYIRGRTDMIGVDKNGTVIAFEAKLFRWRDALNQAYRNTSFAHYSYVVLPAATAKRAARSTWDFVRHSVGLCVATADSLDILIEAPLVSPVLPSLTSLAASAPEIAT